jgi:hypothetical protein
MSDTALGKRNAELEATISMNRRWGGSRCHRAPWYNGFEPIIARALRVGKWRHGYGGFGLSREPLRWSAV